MEKEIELIRSKLEHIENMLLCNKKVMNIDELAEYTGFSKGHLYKLTSSKEIPCYKQNKKLFFSTEEINKWLMKHKISSNEELLEKTKQYVG